MRDNLHQGLMPALNDWVAEADRLTKEFPKSGQLLIQRGIAMDARYIASQLIEAASSTDIYHMDVEVRMEAIKKLRKIAEQARG